MEKHDATYWIKQLNLQPHPEGGYYKEVFRSDAEVVRKSETTPKQALTSIHYLLEGTDYSGFHRLASDEIWYFHKGEPLHIHVIDQQGNYIRHELSDTETGSLSVVVPAGLWFAAAILSASGFTLVSCAVAPGFDFTEFEMAKKEALTAQYPAHTTLLGKFCRE
jgi:predicted cupin superfamily sugar epimerase